jgi:hypothetical protein
VGAKRSRHGVANELWTTTGSLTKLTVRRAWRASGTHKRRLVLRVMGNLPKPGRYSVVITRGGHTLAQHRFRLR